MDHILPLLDAKGVAHWWDGPTEDFVPEFLREEGEVVSEVWRKSTDTMDVWFDSGSSWSMLEDTVKQYGPQRKHLADVCLEGSDQHRGWFQSQLLTAVASESSEENAKTPQSPYKDLITHGMVLDQNGKKMSKSLGNIISPMTVIHGGKVRDLLESNQTLMARSRTRKKSQHMERTYYGYGRRRRSIGRILPSDPQF